MGFDINTFTLILTYYEILHIVHTFKSIFAYKLAIVCIKIKQAIDMFENNGVQDHFLQFINIMLTYVCTYF